MMFYLIHHPETEYKLKGLLKGHKDSKLTARGRRTAEKLGRVLEHKNVAKIYSSDLGRCLETSKIVNKFLKVQIVSVSALRERNFGELNGKPVALVEETLDLGDAEELAPGGESFNQMRRRVLDFVKRLRDKKPILIVTHDGGVRAILSECYGVDFTSNKCDATEEFVGAFEVNRSRVIAVSL